MLHMNQHWQNIASAMVQLYSIENSLSLREQVARTDMVWSITNFENI